MVAHTPLKRARLPIPPSGHLVPAFGDTVAADRARLLRQLPWEAFHRALALIVVRGKYRSEAQQVGSLAAAGYLLSILPRSS